MNDNVDLGSSMTDANAGVAPSGHSAGESPGIRPGLAGQFDTLRRNLLDIGTRNRLISAPLRSSRANVLEIVDERGDNVFSALWREGTGFTFNANPNATVRTPAGDEDQQDGEGDLPVYVPPDDTESDAASDRHKDNKLQSRLTTEALQKRLLTLQRESALFEEEQGVNILFLAIGFLKWFETDSSDVARFAPLILVPVQLERDRVRSRFRLRRREDDIEVNLSLQAKLRQDFNIELPNLPEGEDWLPGEYYRQVELAISAKAKWAIEPDSMLLGFFSFSKFLLYRDLDVDQWPDGRRLEDNDLVTGLLVHGFGDDPLPIPEEPKLDDLLEPGDLGHVLDADSSQTAVIRMAADGRNMVVQGPPGTGKSQTIANVIAAAARNGKTILFVAEKMAALEVVHQRLRAAGLDALCLELHSQKANKRAVYEELKRTLELGTVADAAGDMAAKVKDVRDRLNELSTLVNTPPPSFSETPFQIIALLVKHRQEGLELPDFSIDMQPVRSLEQHRRAQAALEGLVACISDSGPSSLHPWRGVRRRLTPVDIQRLGPRLQQLHADGTTLLRAIERGSALLGGKPADEGPSCETLLDWLDRFGDMPASIRGLIQNEPIRRDPDAAKSLLAAADKAASARTEALAHTSEAGLEQQWSAVRQIIAARGRSLFRFLSGDFRRSVAALDSVSAAGAAKTHEERLRRLDSIIAYQMALKHVDAEEDRAKSAFGADWLGHRTRTNPLREALDWYMAARTLPGAAERLDSVISVATGVPAIRAAGADVRSAAQAFARHWDEIGKLLDLDVARALPGNEHAPEVGTIVEHVAGWLGALDRIDQWFVLEAAEEASRNLGLSVVVAKLADGSLAHGRAVDAYRFARAEALWKSMTESIPRLATLRGEERTRLVQDFREFEHELFSATARQIAARHTAGIPSGAQGQMGFVRGQIARRRAHASIRRLMESAGAAVQKIKPIFLMSPISVAQFLPPGGVTFDIVLMDEASQIRPEDAIGAIGRGTSVVVVGDTKQLPPTSFFDRTIGNVAEEDGEEEAASSKVSAGVMESILTLCQARGVPARTLQWHYRSRHPSLIQVSNQAFYERKLRFPPSPELAGRDGLVFHRVKGVYDRGGTRTNKLEAHAVAEAVVLHARENPDLSLGVVALSVAQRDAILAELELLRARYSELESFFDRSRTENFFVKNLENVQGDERDVIFVSICYARDADGYMSQSFGPVSSEGGERRLNVLFTRAKRRCEIFSSIGHADIDLRGLSVSVGRRVLSTFLKFAETGESDSPGPTGHDAESDFEVAVGNAIRSAGYEVDYQVGSAGFRIDIGIREPGYASAYLLGVECDGATYHSALWARERDRLRQQVLESKGWRLHRIWSADWFNRPEAELRKLLAAIDRAKAAHHSDVEAAREARQARIEIERGRREAVPASISVPYREADVPTPGTYGEPHAVPVGLMAQYVAEIVAVEQPIHSDEIARRVARAWGAQRTGARIRAHVQKALSAALAEGKISGGPFWTISGGSIQVRDRSAVSSSTLRQPDYLPPEEIDVAICQVIARSVAIGGDEAAKGVADALGFGSTTSILKGIVQDRVASLVAAGTIVEIDGLLRIEG